MMWVSIIQVFLVMGLAVSLFEYMLKRGRVEGEEKKALAVHFLVRVAVLGGAMAGLDMYFG